MTMMVKQTAEGGDPTSQRDAVTVRAAEPDVRSFCLYDRIGDSRADAAFDLLLMWINVNGTDCLKSDQRMRSQMCRAIEVRGRNDGSSGMDQFEWDSIVAGVVTKFVEWLQLESVCVIA